MSKYENNIANCNMCSLECETENVFKNLASSLKIPNVNPVLVLERIPMKPELMRLDEDKKDDNRSQNPVVFLSQSSTDHLTSSCQECHISCASFKHLCAHYSKEHQLPTVALTRVDSREFNEFRRNHEEIVKNNYNRNFGLESQKEFSIGDLKKHEIFVHGRCHEIRGQPYKCDLCNLKFSYSKKLEQHKLVEHTGFRFKCYYCRKQFKSLLSSRQHQAKIHESSPHKCKLCEEKFSHLYFLKRHKFKEHPKVKEDPKQNDAIEKHDLARAGKSNNSFQNEFRVDDNDHEENLNAAEENKTEKFSQENDQECEQQDCENSRKPLNVNNYSQAEVQKSEETRLGAHLAICKECQISCASFKNLCVHYSTQHNLPNVALTRLQNYEFTQIRRISQRIVTRRKNNNNLGVEFQKELSTGQNLKRNKSAGDQQHRLECKICQKTYSSKPHLKRHKLAVHEGFRYKCAACQKEFSQSQDLRYHVLSVHDKIHYKCDQCPLKYAQRASLKKHKLAIHDGVRFKCDICLKDLCTSNYLGRHRVTVHGVTPQRLDNHELNRIRSNYEGIVTRSRSNIHKLSFGLKSRKQLSTGKNMKRNKSAVGPQDHFECNICEKTYSSKPHLQRHKIAAHEGLRYKCAVCRKDYSRSEHLRLHVLNVHEEIRYECNECPCKFTLKSSLKNHKLRIHDGVRFQCNKCFRDFGSSSYLGRHKVTVHGVILQRKEDVL